jgi:hypothetical protein
MPSARGLEIIIIRIFLFFTVSLLKRFRGKRVRQAIKRRSTIFPRWVVLIRRGALLFVGSFLVGVRISLAPFGVVGFHFPVLGIGLRFSLWVIVTLIGGQARSLQYKKEYLGDSTLRAVWVMISILIERIRRGARAITLGARIRVNIIIGGILHRVIGETRARWGILGLAVLEILVVLIQVYVFTLLLCFYTIELG